MGRRSQRVEAEYHENVIFLWGNCIDPALFPGECPCGEPDRKRGHNASMALIEPGKKAPAFTLADQDGKTHRLADYAGRSVVLYFYPKDDTPGCTAEACAFRDNLPSFKTSRAAVLGVSILDESSKARFAKKHDLTFPLLADEDHAVAEKYGVWQKKSMYGRTFMGIARTTYLIGKDGKVAKRWDNVKVNGHAEDVLASTL
jgi:peroxiredoxin Q/BCP